MCSFGEVPVDEFQELRPSLKLIADQFINADRSASPGYVSFETAKNQE